MWSLAVGLLLLAAGLVGAALVETRAARQAAQTSADLGALAGAAYAAEGRTVACGRAGELATANGGRMRSCLLTGFEIEIVTVVLVTPLPGVTRSVVASARAGPVR